MAVQGVACDGCVVDGGAWTVSADVGSDAVTDAEADVKGPYLPAAWVASDLPFYYDHEVGFALCDVGDVTSNKN